MSTVLLYTAMYVASQLLHYVTAICSCVMSPFQYFLQEIVVMLPLFLVQVRQMTGLIQEMKQHWLPDCEVRPRVLKRMHTSATSSFVVVTDKYSHWVDD